MISRNPSFNELQFPNQVILKTVYEAGMRMQDAFPSFTADEREFIMTGICPTCWDSM